VSAYPEAADFMVEVLAKYHFVDALDLPEEDVRVCIGQNKPATLRDALQTMALELESHQLASKQKTQFMREPQQEEGHPVQQQQIADHRTRVLGMFFSSWWKF